MPQRRHPPLGPAVVTQRPLRPGPFICPGLKKRLQNQHRRHLVDDPLAPHRRMSRVIQVTVSLRRRQPLVPQMHRYAELRPEILSKRLRLRRLRALVPRHIQRIAHHRLGHPMLTKHPRHRLQIRSPPRPMQRKQRLRGISQRVRDRQPNPPVPYIEPKHASHQRTRRLRRPGRSRVSTLTILITPRILIGSHEFESTCSRPPQLSRKMKRPNRSSATPTEA
jgi:hypothetical protein